MQVCKKCKHLIDPAEVHECPSEAYTQERNSLVSDACEAETVCTDYELEESAYKIVRVYQKDGQRDVIKRGLTLEEAQEHCEDPETSSFKCESEESLERTRVHGPWMDCYYEE